MKSLILHSLFLIPALPMLAGAQALTLVNPLGIDRQPEIVEVPLSQIARHLPFTASQASNLVALDSGTGKRVPSQLYTSTPGAPPDTLLLLVQVPARGSTIVSFRVDPSAAPVVPLVFGREAPERKDDFAWENELVTYRVYGPALQATGEVTSGIDVWSKRVPNFVIDSFYKRDLEGIRTHNPTLSYHKDNGVGLDSYYVGPTRGCGGTAVFSDNRLFVSKNYTTMRMIANGPIRFEFEVSYAPWDANGTSVAERKRITLDAGTHLNKITSIYTFADSKPIDVVAALAVHNGADALFPVKSKIAAVWDTPQDATAGRIATGLIAAPAQHAETLNAAGHAMLVFRRNSGVPFVYYAGSGWSKGSMPDAAHWVDYLEVRLDMI